MGMFSKRHDDPLVYPAVVRTVHVRAAVTDVVGHLRTYSELWSPKRSAPHEVLVGAVAGWTAIRLPERVHPWQLHNLAFWMLDCPGSGDGGGVIAESAAGPDHVAYRLVPDPVIGDALCGWDDRGDGWTVHVPGNDVVRGEEVPVPRSFAVPTGYQDWKAVPVLLEDPGRGMNERNDSTSSSRRHLVDRDHFVY